MILLDKYTYRGYIVYREKFKEELKWQMLLYTQQTHDHIA